MRKDFSPWDHRTWEGHPLLDPPETKVQNESMSSGGSSFKLPTVGEHFRHKGWAHNRERVYASLRRTSQPTNRILSFDSCGSHAYVLKSVLEPGKYRVAGSTCHDRFCVPCANDRSRVIAQNVVKKMAGGPCRFVTLTIRSDKEPLKFLLGKLLRSFKELRRRDVWKDKVSGGVGFLEIKWSSMRRRWHPHLHLLVKGKFIVQKDLSAEWRKITKDSKIVDVRLVKSERKAAKYVTKYASKPLNNTFVNRPKLLDEAVLALKGRRLCMTFGDWRGLLITETVNEDEWVNLGSLQGWVNKAVSGDEEALVVIKSLFPAGVSKVMLWYGREPPQDIVQKRSDNICYMFRQDWFL